MLRSAIRFAHWTDEENRDVSTNIGFATFDFDTRRRAISRNAKFLTAHDAERKNNR
jgi:hypothetical protein